MEEARMDFLDQIGWNYARFEDEGIISPVVEVDCKYRKTTTFSEEISITVALSELRGARFALAYEMKNEQGYVVSTGHSKHCFTDRDGNLVRLKKQYPDFYHTLENLVSGDKRGMGE
jgi:acyl-CoA thioester hydrolase